MKKFPHNQKIVVVFCSAFLLTLSGCVTDEDIKELEKIEVELDDAIKDLEKTVDDFENWSNCMELYDYDPPEGLCE
jgi:hypothetical protein